MQISQIKSIVIAVLAVALVGVGYYAVYGSPSNPSPDKAVQGALNYINTKVLSGPDKAVLDGKVSKESGVYKMSIKVGGESFPSYLTKDGKLLFPQMIKVETVSSTQANSQPVDTAKACATLNPQKIDSPQIEAFVVSQCPYGLQMQRVLTAIANNSPELANNIKIKYIGAVKDGKITSMHGDEEAQENLRQICVREEQKDKFFAYLGCFIQEGKSAECLKTVAVNEAGLKTCMAGKGLEYAQADFADSAKYGVEGSPTMILNGQKVSEYDFGGRNAQAVKELLCCGFATKSPACSVQLSSEQANVGLSKDYSGGSSTGGSCK